MPHALLCDRNEDKTQQKIVDIQKDIADNQSKSEKLQNDLKQMDVDAGKLLDEHKKAMVCVFYPYCRSTLLVCELTVHFAVA